MNPAAVTYDPSASGRRWKSSLVTLYREPILLLSSVLCPCAAYRQASAAFEKEPADCCESVCGGVCFCCGFDLRSRFREKYNLRGNEGQDFCIHCWCNCCGLAQIRREAKLWNADRERAKTLRIEPGPSKNTGTRDDVSIAGEIPLIERTKQTEEEIVPDDQNTTPPPNTPESRWAEHASHISYTPSHGLVGDTTRTAMELGELMDRVEHPSGELEKNLDAGGTETAADLINGKRPVQV